MTSPASAPPIKTPHNINALTLLLRILNILPSLFDFPINILVVIAPKRDRLPEKTTPWSSGKVKIRYALPVILAFTSLANA
ncbi:MAG: hypothetical protein E5W64_03635, partial [Mesorhizobium sp.]